MALNQDPQTATNIIKFDGKPGRASSLRYDVSMPGRYRGRRVLHLDLGLQPGDVLPAATELTNTIKPIEWKQDGAQWTYVAARARQLWFEKALDGWANIWTAPSSAAPNGIAARDVLTAMAWVAAQKPATDGGLLQPLSIEELESVVWSSVQTTGEAPDSDIDFPRLIFLMSKQYADYVGGLAAGLLTLPAVRPNAWPATATARAVDILSTSTQDAHLFLVELYGISSFLGDYGLGRTVRTFTLLPGEETKITMKNWRTETTKAAKATSIVDSYDEKAVGRFSSTVQNETTDKSTRNDKVSWHVEAEVGASWGWGNAKVSGGAAGENQSGREQFAKDVTNAVKEHCAESASNRSNTVSLSTETSGVIGQETATERTIRNVNLRRVLNFVFRELNQEYVTYVHLMEVRVGYATSTTDSYREVPLAGLRPLLEDVLVAGKVDEVAAKITGLAGTVMAADGPVITVEKLTLNPDGTYGVVPAVPDMATGQWAPPPADRSFLYRWKPGPLGQKDSAQPVDGVVMSKASIVMPTADLVVEALLGQADALDDFAMATQYEDADAKALTNRKAALALDTLEAIGDPKERAEAWLKMFPPSPGGV